MMHVRWHERGPDRVKQRFGLGGRIAVREVNDAQMEIQFDPLKRGP